MKGCISMQQVHENNVVRVNRSHMGQVIKNCDALISDDPKVTLSVRVADCLPISFIDKKNHVFGIVHAGWRGLDKKIIVRTVWRMVKEFLIDPKGLEVSIGPHICAKHYEVKKDVSDKFANFPGATEKVNKKILLDLEKIAEFQLIETGIKKENITKDKRCTFEDKNLFSYRRDKTLNRNIILFNPLG
jgi:polyphenol oxidase